VYAADVAAPYTPLAVELGHDHGQDHGLLASWSLAWPPPTSVHLDQLDETLPVHHGTIVATGRLRLRWSPPPSIFGGLDDAVRRRAIEPGVHPITCTLRYQACRDDACIEPRVLRCAIPITVEATAVAAPPTPIQTKDPR
jgi:hypothetical protein